MSEKRTLTFAEEYALPVLRGEKTATVRYPAEPGPPLGTYLTAELPDGTEFATLEVKRTVQCLAVEVCELLSTMGAKHGAPTPDELLENLAEHYPDASGFTPGTPVKVVVFERCDHE